MATEFRGRPEAGQYSNRRTGSRTHGRQERSKNRSGRFLLGGLLTSAVPMLCLGMTCFSPLNALANGQRVTVQPFESTQWRGHNSASELADNTILYTYVAETPLHTYTAEDKQIPGDLVFQVTYFPRFQCSPLIGFYVDLPFKTTEEQIAYISEQFAGVEVSIDGDKVAFPALVEHRNERIFAFFDANLQRRTTLRILLDLGSHMQFRFKGGAVMDFSLLGSRRAVEIAKGRCKSHN